MKTERARHFPDSWRMLDHCLKNGHAAELDVIDGPGPGRPDDVEKWTPIIEQKLPDWARNPAMLEDDGLAPPSAPLVERAIDFARALQRAGYPAPTSVVPDANGGIVFHHRHGETSEEVHFWDDSSVEYLRYQGAKLVERGLL